MTKKLISAVLLLCMVFSLCQSIYAAPNSDSIIAKAKLLAELGIINEVTNDEELNTLVTRRDFITATAKMLGINIYERKPDRYYVDMTEDDLAWNAAAVLLEMNILTMNHSRTLRPDDIITRDEASCILIKTLGVTGLDYETTLTIAGRAELLDGVSNRELTKADAICLLHNALNTYMFNYIAADTENFKLEQGSKTLMDVYYDLHHIEGIVNAVNHTSIVNENGYGENTICIGDTVIHAEINDPYAYLGNYVSVYYTDNSGIYELKHISVRENKTKSAVVDIDDFISFDSENYIIEYTENNRVKNVSITKGVNIIKNGETISSNISNVFDYLERGELILINADGDSAYETVIINTYEDIVVRYVDTENKIIYGTGSDEVIDLSDESKPLIITNASGETKTISDISKDNTVSLFASSKMNRLVVSNLTVTGEISTISVKHGKKYVTLNQTVYPVDKAFTDANPDFLKVRNRVTAYINAYGKAVEFIPSGTSGGIYAWIIDYRVGDGFDDKVYIKMFTENSEIISLPVSSNVKIDGNKCTTVFEIESALSSENRQVAEQLVIVDINADDEIRSMDTSAEGNAQNGLYKIAPEAGYYFYSGQMLLGPKIHLSSSSKLFVVPESDAYKGNENYYQIATGNTFFKDWEVYSITGYRTGKKGSIGYAEALTYKSDLGGTAAAKSHANVFIIEDINEVYDEAGGEIREQLNLIYGSSETSYLNADGYSFADNTGVKPGNVIKIKLNSFNEINEITLLYGERTDGTQVKASNNTVAFDNTGWDDRDSYAIGYVTAFENGLVGISMEKDEEPFLITATSNKPVAVYDPAKSDAVFAGGESDLIDAFNNGYKVVVDISRGNVRSYSVIKVKN